MQRHRVGVRLARVLAFLLLTLPLLYLAGPSATVSADATTSVQMLQLSNQMRAAVGAPTIPADARVVAAAQNHANYNAANRIVGHYETAGQPYYTGYAPRDRVIAAGLTTTFVSEVATGGSNSLSGVQQLWDAPYHRLGLMHPQANSIGWGHSDLAGSATVADITYDFGFKAVDFVRSPANGQTNVPASWSGHESPNPLPAGVSGPVGYPIMVVYGGAPRVDMRAAEIVAPNGTRLPIYYAAQQFESDYQVIIPQQPLATNTTYHVRFDINVAGVMKTNEWDFSTGATISGGGSTSTVPADSGLHSAWVSQTSVPTLQPAGTTSVTLGFRNSGSKTWTKGVAGSQIALGIPNDSTVYSQMGMNVGWPSANRVALQNESSVAPGNIATFTFTVRAPMSLGTVNIPVRPVIDGVVWLEDQGAFVPVTTFANYHSDWATQSAYPTLRAGQVSSTMSFQFRNTGTSTWNRGTLGQEARLGINGDNEMWAALAVAWPFTTRPAVQAESSVAPGQLGTFSFQIRAPSTPGVYDINVRPVIDGVTWMEDQGVFLIVTVVP
jgi:uncharacterized protein YkwD